jgi:MSHA pilin protein MshA
LEIIYPKNYRHFINTSIIKKAKIMNIKLNMNKQQGFTLIELVMVIVILGILAATALPKFADMQSQARLATLNGTLGAVNAAIAITHSEALLENKLAGTVAAPQTVTLESGLVNTVYGYPAKAAGGLDLALTLSPEFTYDPATGLITLNSAKDKTTCIITYTEATSAIAAGITTITAATATIDPVAAKIGC